MNYVAVIQTHHKGEVRINFFEAGNIHDARDKALSIAALERGVLTDVVCA